MSLESFTRHCRGTVTSITFTFSLFLLLSLTNFPYQALTMMSPEDGLGQGGAAMAGGPLRIRAAGTTRSCETPAPTPSPKRPGLLTHSGLFGLDYSSDRFLHQLNLQRTRMSPSGPPWAPPLRATATCPVPVSPALSTSPGHRCYHRSWKNNSLKGKKEDNPHHLRKPSYGTSLVAQWLRTHLPMQGMWVPALVPEDPTCRGATKPMHHNY